MSKIEELLEIIADSAQAIKGHHHAVKGHQDTIKKAQKELEALECKEPKGFRGTKGEWVTDEVIGNVNTTDGQGVADVQIGNETPNKANGKLMAQSRNMARLLQNSRCKDMGEWSDWHKEVEKILKDAGL